MRDGIRFLAAVGLGLVVVIGCGGSSPSAAGTQPAATTGQGASAPASAAAATSQPSTAGGGTATGVCGLVTTDELGGIFGVPVTTEVLAGPPDTCTVKAGGAAIMAFVLTPSGGGAVYDAYAADPSATPVSGMGDKAAYSPTAQLLVILKGDALLSMSAFDQSKTPEERLELLKKVGVIAAGRM